MLEEKRYALYYGDEFITEGTIDELAEREGVLRETIYQYATPSYAKRRGKKRVEALHDKEVVNNLNLDKLLNTLTNTGLKPSRIAFEINMSPENLYHRLKGAVRFKESELRELEAFLGVPVGYFEDLSH